MSVMLTRWAKLHNLTNAEKALEPAIASLGVPYRAQHALWALGVFADFALLNQRLVIEVDDPGHARRKKADAERTAKLNRAGWRVVRTTNAAALSNPYATVDRLMEEASLPLRTRKA